MPGSTYKGSRNIKGKSSRKSSRSKSRRNSRSRSKNTKEETFVEAILSDMPRASGNLTKMDQAMGNRTQTGLINPQNIEYDPLHIQYMVQQSNDMSHLNKYAYSADQIMGNQMGAPQMMSQMGAPQMMPQMGAPQMMPQMGAPQMMPQMGAQPMMFGSREEMDNVPEGAHEMNPEGAHPEGAHEMNPEGAHPEGAHEMNPEGAHPEDEQAGGADLVELLAEKLRNNSLSNRQLRQLKRILQ
jgi:hypothetical protein